MVYLTYLKYKIKNHKSDDNKLSDYLKYYFEIQRKKTNKKSRLKTCLYTKNNRGVYSFFQLSRHNIKRLANLEKLPGITKSSW